MKKETKLNENELKCILGGEVGGGANENALSRNNRNWLHGCTCDYDNHSIRNINRGEDCSCNCI